MSEHDYNILVVGLALSPGHPLRSSFSLSCSGCCHRQGVGGRYITACTRRGRHDRVHGDPRERRLMEGRTKNAITGGESLPSR